MKPSGLTRRDALSTLAALGVGSLAGCSGLLERRSTREPPVLESRPNAIYYPTHVEGMEMIGRADAGDLTVALFYSYAHRFWRVTGTETNRVDPGDDDVHLMAAVWDTDSGTVVPFDSGLSITVERDGEEIASRPPWTMLSQNMGFHYGDNYSLSGNGTYTVTVDTGTPSVQRVGAFADRFEESATATFEWRYSSNARDDISFRELDRAGERGAVEPMGMDMPLSVAPDSADLPGDLIATGDGGDVQYAATVVSREDGSYFAVSPRTRYNGYVLPSASLSGALVRDGETIFDDALRAGIGPDLGYHYGASVDAVESGDELTVTVDAPPQVSRHEGYETAFKSVPDATLTFE